MIWFQNAVIVIAGYLLSQYLVATGGHRAMVGHLAGGRSPDAGALAGAVLYLSWGLSIFLSHSIVVIVLLPLLRRLIPKSGNDAGTRRLPTLLYLALVTGSTAGSMASITGSPMNLLAAGIADIYGFDGYRNLNFSTWLLIGIPATALLLPPVRAMLGFMAAGIPAVQCFGPDAGLSDKGRRPLLFIALNLGFLFLLSVTEQAISPPPLLGPFGAVDIAILLYLIALLFLLFILPRRSPTPGGIMRNSLFLLLFIPCLPLYALSRMLVEIGNRSGIKNLYHHAAGIDRMLSYLCSGAWSPFFGEPWPYMGTGRHSPLLSIRRIAAEAPWFGILLLGLLALVLVPLAGIGDNPATPEPDGTISVALRSAIMQAVSVVQQPFLVIVSIGALSAFSSELLTGSAVTLLATPVVGDIANSGSLPPLIVLLVIVLSSGNAFMTPAASPAATLAYGGLGKVSLGMVLLTGLVLNLLFLLWISALFYGLSMFF